MSFRLSCEKWTKIENLIDKKGIIKCPECKEEHFINVEQTMAMPKNIEVRKRKQVLEELKDKSFYSEEIEKHFTNIKNEITLQVEDFLNKINTKQLSNNNEEFKKFIGEFIENDFQINVLNGSSVSETIEKFDKHKFDISHLKLGE